MPPGDTPSLDPQRSLKRAMDQLTHAVKSLDKHFESLNEDTQGGYLSTQKESAAARKIREAGWSVAQAQAPVSQPQQAEPGSIHKTASTIPEIVADMKAKEEQPPIEKAAEAVRKAGEIGSTASQAGSSGNLNAVRNAMRETHIRQAGGAEPGLHGPQTWEEAGSKWGAEEPEREAERLGLIQPPKPQTPAEKELQEERMTGFGGMEGWMSPAQMERERVNHPEPLFQGNAWKLERRAGIGRNLASKAAASAGAKGWTGSAKAAGGVARGFEAVHENAQVLSAGLEVFNKIRQQGEASTIEGVGLGYTGENVPGGQFLPGGFRNPLSMFSTAGSEGFGLKAAAIENALKGNLGMGESMQIQQNLAAQGWSNERSGGIAGDLLGVKNRGRNQELTELVSGAKRQGLSEQTALEFTEGIRYGGGSIKGLTELMEGLGKSAKDAGMSTDQFAKSITEYTGMLKGQGTFMSLANKGKEITEMTGRPAAWTAQTAESAMGQAAAATYGVLPGTIGGTTAEFQTSVAHQAISQYAKMTRGIVPEKMNPYTGQKEKMGDTTSAKVAEISMLSGGMVNPNESKQFLEHPEREEQLPFAIGAVGHGLEEAREDQKHGVLDKDVTKKRLSESWNTLKLSSDHIVGPKEMKEAYKLDKGGIKSREKLQEDIRANTANQESEKGEIGLTPEAKKFFKLNFPDQYKQIEQESREGKGTMAQNATKKSTGKSSSPLKTALDVGEHVVDIGKTASGVLHDAASLIP